MKIAFFSFGILEQGGGFENYLIKTTRDLADRYSDLDITIVTMSPERVEKLQHMLTILLQRKHNPKGIYRETYGSIQKSLGKNVKYVRVAKLADLADILKRSDLIYSKNEVLELAVLNKLGLAKLPPIIIGVHTPIHYPYTPSLSSRLHNFVYTGTVYRRLIKGIRSIQVNNHDDLELVRQKIGFANVNVIRQAFDAPPLKQKVNRPGKLKVLFVGRLTEQKGIDILLGAVQLLEQKHKGSFNLKIAGSGEAKVVRRIKIMARTSDCIDYLGHIHNKGIGRLYDWADVTVIPSKYETLNKVAVETALAGKIAVCTDIPGPREVVQNGITGFLLPPDPSAFAGFIANLADLKKTDPGTLQTIGQSAYAYVKAKFDPDKAYGDMYTDMVNTVKT